MMCLPGAQRLQSAAELTASSREFLHQFVQRHEAQRSAPPARYGGDLCRPAYVESSICCREAGCLLSGFFTSRAGDSNAFAFRNAQAMDNNSVMPLWHAICLCRFQNAKRCGHRVPARDRRDKWRHPPFASGRSTIRGGVLLLRRMWAGRPRRNGLGADSPPAMPAIKVRTT